jgi:hypothetical protein
VEIYNENIRDARIRQREEIISIAIQNNPNFRIGENISKYGRSNDQEFFAECFANAMCGSPNELGIAMQEWLRRQGYAD